MKKAAVVALAAAGLVEVEALGVEQVGRPHRSTGGSVAGRAQLLLPWLLLNVNALKRKASHARDLGEMEKRVEAQFATLIATGIRHVVLSAFGCGAFENDPSDIAWLYKQAVERHRAAFTVIAFAIFYAGHGEDNYKIFKASLAPED